MGSARFGGNKLRGLLGVVWMVEFGLRFLDRRRGRFCVVGGGSGGGVDVGS